MYLACITKTRCIALVCVCDSVAKAMVQNFKQFNGAYGCSYCVHTGKIVPKGNRHVRVYPLSENMPVSRVHAEVIEHASKACTTSVPEYSVKGPSPLMLLPHHNIVDGVPPDYMHSVLLGVTMQFIDSLTLETMAVHFI